MDSCWFPSISFESHTALRYPHYNSVRNAWKSSRQKVLSELFGWIEGQIGCTENTFSEVDGSSFSMYKGHKRVLSTWRQIADNYPDKQSTKLSRLSVSARDNQSHGVASHSRRGKR